MAVSVWEKRTYSKQSAMKPLKAPIKFFTQPVKNLPTTIFKPSKQERLRILEYVP